MGFKSQLFEPQADKQDSCRFARIPTGSCSFQHLAFFRFAICFLPHLFLSAAQPILLMTAYHAISPSDAKEASNALRSRDLALDEFGNGSHNNASIQMHVHEKIELSQGLSNIT